MLGRLAPTNGEKELSLNKFTGHIFRQDQADKVTFSVDASLKWFKHLCRCTLRYHQGLPLRHGPFLSCLNFAKNLFLYISGVMPFHRLNALMKDVAQE